MPDTGIINEAQIMLSHHTGLGEGIPFSIMATTIRLKSVEINWGNRDFFQSLPHETTTCYRFSLFRSCIGVMDDIINPICGGQANNWRIANFITVYSQLVGWVET